MPVTLSTDRPTKDRLADSGEKWHRAKLYTGTCLDFDGVNDYIDIGDTGISLQTISFVLYADALNQSIIDLDGGTNTITVNSSGVILANGFTNAIIYVDGIENNEIVTQGYFHITITTETSIDVDDLDIGRVSSAYFNGKISNVKMFSIALNSVQVFNNFIYPEAPTPIGVNTTDLVLWLPLNENNSSVTNVYDHSSTGMSGTYSGATWVNSLPAPIPQTAVTGYTNYYWHDAVNDYVSISGVTADFDVYSYFEMTIVFYMPPYGIFDIFTNTMATSNRFAVSRFNNDFFVTTFTGPSIYKSTTDFIDGKLYTLKFTVDNNTIPVATLNDVEMTNTTGTANVSGTVGTSIGSSTAGAWHHKGVIVSVEQTDKHRWTNKGGWVDEIGTDDGTINGSPTQFRLTHGILANKDPYGYILDNKKGVGYFLGNEYAETPDKDNLDITTSISIAAWVKFSNTGSQETVIAKRNAWELAKSSGETVIMSIYQTSNKFTFSTSTLSADTWYYIVGTYTSGTMQIYIDGVLDKTDTSYTGNIDTTVYNVTVGQNNSSTYWTGNLDEIKVYDTVLTVDEIISNYRAGLAAHT